MPKKVYTKPIGKQVENRTWTATPKQMEFLSSEEDEVLYGGSVGGGKTDALLIFCILRRQGIPGSRGLFVRRTFVELERSAIMRMLALLHGTGVTYQAQHHRFIFPNGSVQEFGHVETDADVYKYLSAEYEDLCIDEAGQLTEFQYTMLISRLRTTIPGVKCVVRCASNPGGVGHAFLKKRFIDPAPPGEVFIDPETGLSRRFIPATLDDNPHLDKASYERRLLSLPEAQRRAYRYGDWDLFEGQFFSEFQRMKNGKPWHVIKPSQIPEGRIPDHWRRWRSIDWGYSQPACCLWLAQSPAGKIYVYRELYVNKLTATELAERILALSGDEDIRLTLADPSLWNRSGQDGVSIEEAMKRVGLRLTKSTNDRIAGWQRVRECLMPVQWDDGTESPRLQIFEACVNLIRTLPQLIHDARHPEDIDTRGEDHAADALRYALAVRVDPPLTEEARQSMLHRRKRLIRPVVSSITGY